MIGALGAAVIALVASGAMAAGTLGPSLPGPATRGAGQGLRTGMMASQGQGSYAGVMGVSMMGSRGMVWLRGNGVAVSAISATRARAATAAQEAGLHPGAVMWFDNGFYVELKDSAGQPATEVIVDPGTGMVSTEPVRQ